MQPYFFPYLGYFALIKHSDRFVVLDTVQFIKQGWIERNRIIKPGGGWQYIQVPLVKHHHDTLIKDVKIKDNELWRKRICNQLDHYRKGAPYYKIVIELLKNALVFETDSISSLNTHILDQISDYLGIHFNGTALSSMDGVIDRVNAPDEWALKVCKTIGAKTYINLPGGISFFDRNKYTRSSIELQFIKVNIKPYNQGKIPFEDSLSIIDVMMFNTASEIRGMLDDYEIL